MVKNISILFISAFFMLFNVSSKAASSSIDDYKFMTEDYPPFNYGQADDLKGISIELWDLILKKLNSKKTIKEVEVLPWARSYNNLQSEDNTLLFVMTRTTERENLFKWVGPVAPTKIVIVAPKSKNIKISSFADLFKYKIGVVRDDVAELLLLSNNVPKSNIYPAVKLVDNIKKLLAGRVDAISYEESVLKWTLKQEGEKVSDYETIFPLKEGEVFFAFNKNTPDDLIDKVQEAFDQVKQSVEYKKIMDKYFN